MCNILLLCFVFVGYGVMLCCILIMFFLVKNAKKKKKKTFLTCILNLILLEIKICDRMCQLTIFSLYIEVHRWIKTILYNI